MTMAGPLYRGLDWRDINHWMAATETEISVGIRRAVKSLSAAYASALNDARADEAPAPFTPPA